MMGLLIAPDLEPVWSVQGAADGYAAVESDGGLVVEPHLLPCWLLGSRSRTECPRALSLFFYLVYGGIRT